MDKKLDVQGEFVGETEPPFSIDDDTAKSVSMRCVGIVGIDDRAKRLPGFEVVLDCGSGGAQVSLCLSCPCLW